MKYLNTFFKLYSNNQFIRYLSIGSVNTFVGIITYPVLFYSLTSFDLSYIEILYVSFFITTSFAFITNKYIVFRSRYNFIYEYFKFIFIHIIFLVLNVFVLKMLVEDYEYHPVISQIILTFIIIYIGYYYNRIITFKN